MVTTDTSGRARLRCFSAARFTRARSLLAAAAFLLGTFLATSNASASQTFAQWAAAFGLTGGNATAAATPQNDYIPNLIKYLTDIDPTHALTAADRAALPTLGLTTSSGTTFQTVTFREYSQATGLTITAETSPDLQTWTTASSSPSQVGTDSISGDPILQFQVPYTGNKQFFRLNVVVDATAVHTVPEGAISFAVQGNQNSYVSLPLNADPIYTGSVSNVTANTITVINSPAPFAPGALAITGAPYFVRFLTGAEAGRTLPVSGNTDNVLTLDISDNGSQAVPLTTTGFSVSQQDTFEVFPGQTLASFFGNGTVGSPLLVNGGSSVITADTISIYDPVSFQFFTYFFNTTLGQWVALGSPANANNTVLFPASTVVVDHRGGSQLTLFNSGRVPEVALLTKTPGSGAVVYSSGLYPVDVTLSSLNLGSNWQTGSSSIDADTISVYNPQLNSFNVYFQSADSEWHLSGSSVNAGNTVISAQSGIAFLQRKDVSGGAAFIGSVLPYTP